MRKLLSLLTAVLLAGSMWATPVEIYKNEGTTTTINGVTVSGNVNTKNGNPAPSFANTTEDNATFTFNGFNVSSYSNLTLSLDAKFGSFPATTNTWPYLEVKFYKDDEVVQTDVTTVKWTSKDNNFSTYEIDIDEDFDKIVCIGHPAIGKTGKGADATNYAIYFDNFTISGDAAGATVLPPTIAPSGTEFYGEIEVSITCDTEGATIYYTLDGNDPTALSTEYTGAFNLNEDKTVKAIAIKDESSSTVSSITYTIHPSFESIEALVTADLDNNTVIEVSFDGLTIDSVYNNGTADKGIYIDVLDKTGLKAVEIYFGTGSIPNTWVVGGTVSGTIRGTWKYFSTGKTWEVVPLTGFKWTDLTYVAPPTYAVSFADPAEGGTLEIFINSTYAAITSGDEFPAGTELLVWPTATSGYTEGPVKVVKTGVSPEVDVTNEVYDDGEYILIVPAYAITVSVSFSEATALDKVENEVKAVKTIVNGQLFIEKNGHVYNAMGQMVK